jgi:hypothetical protein
VFGLGLFSGTTATGTPQVVVNSNGNVGINTTSPSQNLHVASSGVSRMLIENTANQSTGAGIQMLVTSGGTQVGNGTIRTDNSDNMQFFNLGGERMRITSGGRVLIGATSLGSTGTLNSYTNGADPAARFVSGSGTGDGSIILMVDKFSTTNTTSQWFLGFTINNQGTASGVITANGASQVAFGSWSDFRLKENITNLPSQLDKIMSLRPVEFDYIKSEGGGHQISFIAQEFEKVFPDAVGQRADGMKTLTGWGKTEAILVKAIQELKQELDTLKNK